VVWGKAVTLRSARTVYNTGVMKSLRSWRFARIAALVAAAVLLCLGVLLSWPATRADIPDSLTTAGSPHVGQGANEDGGPPLNGSYLAVPAEEAQEGDKGPVNAAFLTTLLLVVFFGTALGWLLAFDWKCRRPDVSSLIGCCFSSIVCRQQRRPVAAFLGVFRL
jgi:hypothetical protein